MKQPFSLRAHFSWLIIVIAGLTVFASSAPASIHVAFDPFFGSTNSPATGATGTATFSFMDMDGDVQVSVLIENTTNTVNTLFNTTGGLLSVEGGTPFANAGATASKLTAVLFDIPSLMSQVSFFANSFDGDADNDGLVYFNVLLTPANLPGGGFGLFDAGISDNDNIEGGNANNALPEGLSTLVSFKLDTALNAMEFENAWAMELGIRYAARFMQVNAGAGSDKIGGGPLPNPNSVPEPTSLASWSIICFVALQRTARRRRTFV